MNKEWQEEQNIEQDQELILAVVSMTASNQASCAF